MFNWFVRQWRKFINWLYYTDDDFDKEYAEYEANWSPFSVYPLPNENCQTLQYR